MRKANDLRQWLTASLPELKTNPDLLQVYIEEGGISARKGSLSFQYRYAMNLLFQDFSGNQDRVIVPLLAWIEKEQPELLQAQNSEPFTFQAELLDTERYDLLVTIQLTEPVIVTPVAGGYDTHHPPTPVWPDQFAGIGPSILRQCFARRDLVAQSSDPAAPPLTPAIPPEG